MKILNDDNDMVASILFDDIFVVVSGNEETITKIKFEKEFKGNNYSQSSMVFKAAQQLEEYLDGKRQSFDLNLEFKCSDFFKKVYLELINIPFGETKSYSEVASLVGKEKAIRAIGNANNRNPFVIVVPCHRVIGKNGSLTGFAPGLKYKEILLDLEKKNNLGGHN
ncbi:MAG: methylated-DNA--[protein]-cysteine S-methyltransferase [Bacilli bacterium]|jgi:methylated-DNA-[protein]-cysteine S-methyltransferase|nr:methylated-DNA--[protein]-cysteine S-methyltransferase [Bacilli bacterium]